MIDRLLDIGAWIVVLSFGLSAGGLVLFLIISFFVDSLGKIDWVAAGTFFGLIGFILLFAWALSRIS
jgi:hypothetical protein